MRFVQLIGYDINNMKKCKSHKKWNIMMVALFSSVIFLTQYTSNLLFDPGYFSYSAITLIGIIASLLLIFISLKSHNVISINIIDIAFLIFTTLLFISWIGSTNTWIYSKATIALSLIPIYFFIKLYKSTFLIHWAIIVTGGIQIVVSVFQKLNYLPNNNSFFEVAGTFGNPNVLAMVLLLTLASAFYHLRRTNSPIVKHFLICYIIILLSAIVFTKCRTAILGCILFGVCILRKRESNLFNFTSRIFWLSGLGITCLGFIFLIFEKSESMVGRLLIWQSCFTKIVEKPFWGFGISSFHEVYPEAQRLFLKTNSNATYLRLADSPQWAYNDFIELWLESGIFTAISFIGIVISILYCWRTQKRFNTNGNNLAFLSAVIFFIFSIVNFAFTAWPVLIIFIINLAWSSRMCNSIIQFSFLREYWVGLIFALILLSSSMILGFESVKHLQFQYEFKKVDSFPVDMQNKFYSHFGERCCIYAPFIYSYSALLNKENHSQQALDHLQKLNKHAPSYQTNYQLAEIYLKLYNLKMAKYHFKESCDFLPNKIQPHLQLYFIAIAEKKFNKADSIKAWILCHEFKGEKKFICQTKENLILYK